MKNRQVVTIIGAALLSLSTDAAETESRHLAEELLAAMNVESNIAAVRAQVQSVIVAQVKGMNVPETMKDASAKFQQRMIELVFDELSLPKMKSAYVDIYVSTFTAEELAGLVAFYKSPPGRAFVEKLPVLTNRMLEVTQNRLKAVEPRLTKLREDFETEIKEAGTAR